MMIIQVTELKKRKKGGKELIIVILMFQYKHTKKKSP